MRRQWSWVDDLGQEDPSGCRNGEQDAEAVELGVRYRQSAEVMSERRTGCGGSGAVGRADLGLAHPLVGTENRMRRQWSLPGRKRPVGSRSGPNVALDVKDAQPNAPEAISSASSRT